MAQPLVELTADRDVAGTIRTERYTIGLHGGSVSGPAANPSNPAAAMPSRTLWSARMIADQLVIETREYSEATGGSRHFSEHREVWSLHRLGRLVIVMIDRASDPSEASVTLTYERR